MVSFGKNKDDKAAERSRYRYEQSAVANEDIPDVLLPEEKEPPLVAALVEPESSKGDDVIYELVVEEEKPQTESATEPVQEPPKAISLNEQVEKLCSEYAAINQQLEKSLAASNELSKQLEQSKKVVFASYIALGVAGLACFMGIGAVVAGMNMQRDVEDLKNLLAAQTNQATILKQEAAAKNQVIDGQIALLNEKVEKIFAADNLDSVLQVTQELKKQVHALANKNLAAMAAQSHAESHPPKESKVSLPSLKVKAAEEEAPTNKKPASHQAAEKTVDTADADAEKKDQTAKQPAPEHESLLAKLKKHRWRHASKKPKVPNEHVEKKTKLPPELPKLD